MDFRQIEFFLQIMQDHSMTKSSEKLFISQQGLSKSIFNLEKEIGLPLFYKDSKGTLPTSYANILAPYFEHIFSEYIAIQNKISQLKNPSENELNILFESSTMHSINHNLIFRFRQEYPEIKLNVIKSNGILAEHKILTEKADIGFLVGPLESDLLNKNKIKTEEIFVYMHKDHPLSERSRFTFDDLRCENILICKGDFKERKQFDTLCESYHIKPNIIFEPDDLFHLLPALKAGHGIAFFASSMMEHIDTSDLIHIPWMEKKYREILMVTKHNIIKKEVELFCEYVEKNLALFDCAE